MPQTINERLADTLRRYANTKRSIETEEARLADLKALKLQIEREVLPSLLGEVGVHELTTGDGTKLTLRADLTIKCLAGTADMAIPSETNPNQMVVKSLSAHEWIDHWEPGLVKRTVVFDTSGMEMKAITQLVRAHSDLPAHADSKVHPQTLAKWAREMIYKKGQELPPELFDVNAYEFVKVASS